MYRGIIPTRKGRFFKRLFQFVFCATAIGLAGSGNALANDASDWPEHSITLVAPFSPGGSTDMLARVIASAMGKILKQSVVVDNRAGAGGTIGAGVVARSRPDGYTMLLSNVTLGSADAVYKDLPYDFVSDFDHVAYLGSVPCVLVASKSLPVKNVKEFISYLHGHNGKLNFGSSGIGAASHLCTQAFLNAVGAKAIHVPYRGAGPMMIGIMSGTIAFALDTAPNASSHILGGKVLGLAVAADHRIPLLPGLPTLKEAGVPFEMSIWYGLATPKGTPPDVNARIYQAVQAALKTPKVQAAYKSLGAFVTPETPQAFLARVKADKVRWTNIVKQAGIKPQ